MKKAEMIAYCLTYPGVYEDYPFDDEWAVIRHSGNRKAFAFIYERNGQPCVNLKAEPLQIDFWREIFPQVQPAYHMNKLHWHTVLLESGLPEEELFAMVNQSFALTKPKRTKTKSNS